jgi:transposase InsO family protein
MKLADTYPIRLVCRLLDVPRSSVYYAAEPVPDAEALFKTALLDLAGEWPTYGYRRLTALMRRLDWPVNSKRVRRWMHELNLHGIPPTRKRRTTNSNHAFPRYPNLVQGLEIMRPDQVWVADITYIRLRREFVYLAILMDVFTRCIRGWHLARNLDQGLTLAALERALLVATPHLHHSDQGVQYAATVYVERLQGLGVTLSMAAIGEPRENGYAERLIRTIKEEEVDLSDYQDFADARRNIARFLDDVYNVKRIHSALGYLTPREFEEQWRQGFQVNSDNPSRPTGTERGKEGGGSGGRETGAAGSRPPGQNPSPPRHRSPIADVCVVN